jgi:chloramphenicol O-acetyltransferase
MRNSKERRHSHTIVMFPLEDSAHDFVTLERRKTRDRRLSNLEAEERQLLLSEMPWLTFYKLT